MRLSALLILVIVLVGGARPAWSCPTAAVAPSCCCDPPPAGEDLEVRSACCCSVEPASEGTPSPIVATPGNERVTLEPALLVLTPAAPPLVLVAILRPVDRGVDELPPRTLLRLHTLLLC